MSDAECLFCILLIPLATAGLALIHQGLGRSRSAAHTMLATLCAVAVAAVVFVAIGSSWAGGDGLQHHVIRLGGHAVDWLGAEPFFGRGLWRMGASGLRGALVLCLQVLAAGMVAMIPISTGGDRWRLSAICCSSALTAGVFYPLFSHWVWGGGWLAQLPLLAGLPVLCDPGGAAVMQVMAGLASLSVAWVLGPRRGKYEGGSATAIPGHNIVLVLFGCLLTWTGWAGLECAISALFYGAAPAVLVWVAINAMLSASCGLLAAVLTTRLRFRKPDPSISANGWIAGLVAGSAGAGLLSPAQTIFVGLVAGALVTWLIELLEMRLLVDDPGGAIPVHAGAGLWGLLAFGALGPGGLWQAHLLTSLVGIATLLGLMLPLIHVSHLILNRFIPYRVDRDGDQQGMDIRELGSGAYPEFVIHADEFLPR